VALSARELLLVLRARDEATRVVRGLVGAFGDVDNAAMKAAHNQIAAGSGLVSLGAGFAAAGVAGLVWMKNSTDMAVEFDNSIAKVQTQLDKTVGSQKDLGDAVKRTAAEVAVPIDQMTAAFYDIFSSMEVTIPQAESLLKSFSKEAVAGQVDLQAASRATIGILNGFHMKVEDVTRVQDVQFQLVRKGVGTYEEFSKVLGRATPSAARAGQSVETLAGMLAYLTRNGLSAAMASATAGRAFDAFANPKVVSRLEAMGVSIKNAAGEFRPMAEVIVDLQKKLGNLTGPERAAALQKLFAGAGGTIQARRFYDMVLKDAQSVDQFVGLVGDMNNAQGAFGDAYKIMSDTTASRSQLLKNQWQLLRIEVGEALIPVLRTLMDWLSKLLQFWNGLSDATKQQIIIWAAIGAVLFVVLGFVIAMAGAVMVLGGAAAALGISLGALLGTMGLIVIAIAGIIAIIVLLAQHWDEVSAGLKAAWEAFWGVLKTVWDWIVSVIGKQMVDLWHRATDDIIDAVKTVGAWIKKVWDGIVTWTQETWPKVRKIIEPVIQWFVDVWPNVKRALEAILHIIADVFQGAWDIIVGVVQGAWKAISGTIEGIISIFKGLIEFVVGVLTLDWATAWDGIKKIFEGVWTIITSILIGAWDIIKGIVTGALTIIWSIIKNGWDAIVELFTAVVKLLMDVWGAFWQWVWDLVVSVWKGISDGIRNGFNAVLNFFGTIRDQMTAKLVGISGWLWDHGWSLINGLWNGILNVWNALVGWFGNLAGYVGRFFSNAGQWLYDAGRAIIQGLINGIVSMQAPLGNKLAEFATWIQDHKGPIAKDLKLLVPAGVAIIQGLIAGMESQLPGLANFLDGVSSVISDTSATADFTAGGTTSLGVPTGDGQSAAGTTYNNNYDQTINVYTQEIDPRREAAELGHELFKGPG
jgi:TP901 family phage tail tape measure protein